jgi:hypothetical protein
VAHHPLLHFLSAYLALLHIICPWRSDPCHCTQGVWIGAPCFPPYNYSFQVLSPHRCCSLCIDHDDPKWHDLTYIVRRNQYIINFFPRVTVDFVNKPNFAESVPILVPLASRTTLPHCRIELRRVMSGYCAFNSRKSRYRLWGKEYFFDSIQKQEP